jgi:hypothetical protein
MYTNGKAVGMTRLIEVMNDNGGDGGGHYCDDKVQKKKKMMMMMTTTTTRPAEFLKSSVDLELILRPKGHKS